MTFLISSLELGKVDKRGNIVQEIYSIADERYAVYRANNRVSAVFADDPTENNRQRNVFAPLEILRGEIAALLEGWVDALEGSSRARRVRSYSRRLADALILAFRDLPVPAQAALEAIKADLLHERIAIGRRQYMVAAVGVSLVWVALMIIFSRSVFEGCMVWTVVWVAASGCFGAIFSIALNLSARQIQPDTLRSENLLDATLRVSIGAMSALILYALLKAGLVSLSLQGKEIGTDADFGLTTFVASVLAGFLERLVGDFLGSAKLAAPSVTSASPAMADAVKLSNTAVDNALSGPAGGPRPESVVPATNTADTEAEAPDDLHIDGCACDVHGDKAETDDVELPPAQGGVAN